MERAELLRAYEDDGTAVGFGGTYDKKKKLALETVARLKKRIS